MILVEEVCSLMKKNKENKGKGKLLFFLKMKKWAATIVAAAQTTAVKKRTRRMKRKRKLFCMRCAGTGKIPYPATRGTRSITCQICQGTGYVLHEEKKQQSPLQ